MLREIPGVIATLEARGDHRASPRRTCSSARCTARGSRFGDFLQSAELRVHHADLAGDSRHRARAVVAYAFAALYGPTSVPEALRRCEEVLTLAEGDKRAVGVVMCFVANLQAMRGNFDEARALYGLGRGLIEEVGATVSAAATALQSGIVELLADDIEAAERELRRSYDLLTGMGETYFAPSVAALLAHVLARVGRDAEAVELTLVAEELAGSDDVDPQAQWRLARAKALAHQGRRGRGAPSAERASSCSSEPTHRSGRPMRSSTWPRCSWRAAASRRHASALTRRSPSTSRRATSRRSRARRRARPSSSAAAAPA